MQPSPRATCLSRPTRMESQGGAIWRTNSRASIPQDCSASICSFFSFSFLLPAPVDNHQQHFAYLCSFFVLKVFLRKRNIFTSKFSSKDSNSGRKMAEWKWTYGQAGKFTTLWNLNFDLLCLEKPKSQFETNSTYCWSIIRMVVTRNPDHSRSWMFQLFH